MSTHDEPLDLDPHQAFNDFAQVMQTSDQLFDDEQGLLGMSSQPVEAGSVAYFTGQQRALHQQDAGLQAPSDGLSHLARAAEYSRFHDVVPRAVEGKQGLLISVFTSANITTAASSRTRIGALKYLDVPDRAGFMHQLLERISLAKTRLYHHIGFDVRSCTYIVEGEHIWVILIGLVAMSFGKWHKVFLRLGALDIKTVCIHRQLAAGTQSSLETAADMFNGLTTVEELVRHEIVCHQPATPDGAKKGRKRKASPTSKKAASPARKRTTPVSERVQTASPARKQKAVRAALFVSEEQQEDDGQPPFVTPSPCGGFVYARKDLVDECLAFLTSKDMPPVEAHRDRLLEYLTSIPHYGHIGMYMLSQHPLELFARAMHLRVAVIRVLGERYGIDARGSLSTMTLVSAGGYERMTPASQAALRMIGQCVDHDRDFPIFTFLDMVCGLFLISPDCYPAKPCLTGRRAGLHQPVCGRPEPRREQGRRREDVEPQGGPVSGRLQERRDRGLHVHFSLVLMHIPDSPSPSNPGGS